MRLYFGYLIYCFFTSPLPSPLYLLTIPDVDSVNQDLCSLVLESSF